MFYTFATLDKEEIRLVMDVPPKGRKNVLVKAHVEMHDGKVVMEGTVGAGNSKEPTRLENVEMKDAPREELRILAGIHVGDEIGPKDVVATPESMKARLENVEDSIDWYRDASPWGPPIVPLSSLFGLIHVYPNQSFKAVPFFGATELRLYNGPAKVGVQYRAVNKIKSIGTGPAPRCSGWTAGCMKRARISS